MSDWMRGIMSLESDCTIFEVMNGSFSEAVSHVVDILFDG